MVRGNWQRRVEKTEARRNEAKIKKQRNEERRLGKAKLNELLSMLDRNKDYIFSQSHQRSWELHIHIWTDTVLSDWPPLLDMNLDDHHHHGGGSGGGKSSSKRRNRSASIESEGSAGGGGRKPSTHGNKKKAHPRSKEASSSEADIGTSVAAPRLCRFQFFSGKCTSHGSGGKKGGGCRYLHYPKTQKTIADVLLNTTNNNSACDVSSNRNDARNDLNQCESALPEVQDEDPDAGSMEMLYYFSINLTMEAASRRNKDTNNPTISDIVGDVMAKKSCGLGSIVYVALCENLVFDRHREGILMPEPDLMTTVFGLNAAGGATTSGPSSSSTEIDTDIATALPGPVLEYVLTFLPDTAVATMSSVCRSWNTEIGKQSVHLWQHLLQRRSWPLPVVATAEDGPENSPSYDNKDISRKAFLSHYSALRDIKGLKLGMAGLLTKQSVQEREACFRSFEHMKGSPQYPNPCIAVEVSANRILAAYSHDCSLRLFDSVQKSGTGDERLCREILCVCLDPYRNTKKRNCQIVGLALDDEWIGSLFHVTEGSTKGEATLLRVLARENFLLSDDGVIEEDHVKTIDVSQSILNYVLSCDDLDHGVLQLNDFLSSGGDFDDIEVLVSQSIAACGFGRFLVEASISIPLLDETDDDDDDDEIDANMTLLFRRLFLISSGVGAIVWMCSSDIPNRPMRPRSQQLTLTSRRVTGDSRLWHVLTSWQSTLEITSWTVGPSGDFHLPSLLEGSGNQSAEMIEGGWELRPTRHRPMIVASDQIVVGDTYVRDIENDGKEFKAIVSFYSSDSGGSKSLHARLQLEENWEVSSLSPLRDNHILVIGRRYITNTGENELDGIDGHWFGGRTGGHVSLYAIVIHTVSRTEIARICLVEDLEACLDSDIATSGELPFEVAACAQTVSAGVWWKGIVMTGQDVRLAPESTQGAERPQTHGNQKKKKKKTPKKAGKKDGFARGMSLRG